MTPHGHCCPVGTLAQAINRQYSSFAMFQQQFKNNAMAITGSGWTWLIADGDGELTSAETVPSTYSKELITDLARDTMGFTGYINSLE